jgi:hypothetical protein
VDVPAQALPEDLKRTILIAVLLCALLYGGDYLSLRYRIPHNRAQFESVQVQRDYAVRMKNSKTEYMFDDPSAQICVHSLFPHFGDSPCWYVKRHSRQQVNVQ